MSRHFSGLPAWALAIGIALAVPRATSAQQTKIPGDLLGTWELVEAKDVKTGEAIPLWSGRRSMITYTPTRMFYMYMRRDRQAISAEAFAALSAAERANVNYSMIWDDKEEQLFGGFVAKYRLHGDTLTYTRELAPNPRLVGGELSELLLRVDRERLVVRSMPDANGVVREELFRRVD